MAEGAARDGYRVIALDAFGDLDTRRIAQRWQSIGGLADGRLDATRTLAALRQAATEPGVMGWVAGSDFECEHDLLAAGAEALPQIGTAPRDVRHVRDPAQFFATLRRLGLPHPETQHEAPTDPTGWLRKLGRGCGGWHIRRAEHPAAMQAVEAFREPYFQREAPGVPMSALFIAHGADTHDGGHRLVGFNELIVRPLGAHPHVYRGAVGPVALPGKAVAALSAAIDALVATFSLRGLCSLDFLWHDGAWSLLEINPRPSASMALYADQALMREHVEGSRIDAPPPAITVCRGIETVFARTAFRLTAAQAEALASRIDCHDLPAAGTAFAAGDPVCSVSAVENNAEAVCKQLAARRRTLRDHWAAPEH